MIGLGGGHIPLYINKKFPETIIDVVEIDNNVVNVTSNSGFNPTDKVAIHVQDGNVFINESTTIYDVIIMDLDGEPSYDSFNFDKVRNILNPSGLIVLNVFNEHFILSKSSVFDKIKSNFKYIKHYLLSTNNIFICTNNKDIGDKFSLKINKDNISPFMSKHKYLNDLISRINSLYSKVIVT